MMPMGQPGLPGVQGPPIPIEVPAGVPPGLEFLIPTNRILIQQQVELGEVLTGINTNNRYHIFDAWGRRIYFAAENSDCCSIACLGNCRPWNITIFDFMGRPIMQGNRESGCCGACGNSVQVMTSSGVPLGNIIQNCECVSASWNVTDDKGVPVLRINAPACSVWCPGAATCCEADFPVTSLQGGQEIGRISKYFGDILREMYTAADTFGLQFPTDLDAKLKGVLIFATFMIDFMYYENPDNRRNRW